jgi:hypothetical protein
MELPVAGGCLCGVNRYEISQEPVNVYVCHCTDCQRSTSSAFSIAVIVPEEAFLVLGSRIRPAPGGVTAGGREKIRQICADCGTWLYGAPRAYRQRPGLVRFVRAGTLDDTSWLRPTTHLWIQSAQKSITLPEGATLYQTQP